VDHADTGDDAGGGRLAVVQVPGGERRELEEGGAGVDQSVDALAGEQLATGAMAAHGLGAAAGARPGQALGEQGELGLPVRAVGAERGAASIDGGGQDGALRDRHAR
jgi:hypothetical protein